MALSLFLRGASTKLNACPLHSLVRSQLFKCSTVASSQFQHTFVPQSPQCSQKTITKQSAVFITPRHQPGTLMQHVKQFSVTPRQMSSHGDHTKLWTAERALSVALLGVLPGAFIVPCQVMDYLLAVLVVMHTHWGFEAVVVDYVKLLFGEFAEKIAIGALYVVSIATLAGLFFFITSDVGIANCIKQLWRL